MRSEGGHFDHPRGHFNRGSRGLTLIYPYPFFDYYYPYAPYYPYGSPCDPYSLYYNPDYC